MRLNLKTYVFSLLTSSARLNPPVRQSFSCFTWRPPWRSGWTGCDRRCWWEVPGATRGTTSEFSTHSRQPSNRCASQPAALSAIDAWLLEPHPTPATIRLGCWEEVREAKEWWKTEERAQCPLHRLWAFPFPSPDSQSEQLVSSECSAFTRPLSLPS